MLMDGIGDDGISSRHMTQISSFPGGGNADGVNTCSATPLLTIQTNST